MMLGGWVGGVVEVGFEGRAGRVVVVVVGGARVVVVVLARAVEVVDEELLVFDVDCC